VEHWNGAHLALDTQAIRAENSLSQLLHIVAQVPGSGSVLCVAPLSLFRFHAKNET